MIDIETVRFNPSRLRTKEEKRASDFHSPKKSPATLQRPPFSGRAGTNGDKLRPQGDRKDDDVYVFVVLAFHASVP